MEKPDNTQDLPPMTAATQHRVAVLASVLVGEMASCLQDDELPLTWDQTVFAAVLAIKGMANIAIMDGMEQDAAKLTVVNTIGHVLLHTEVRTEAANSDAEAEARTRVITPARH